MGGPYPMSSAGMGGIPTVTTDNPICAVFLLLYVCFAATNMTIFQNNRRKGHKFILSVLLFGFCMARIATLSLRIGWSVSQHNVRLAIAANIFVNAGILLVYIINLILAQRILRAKLPHIGWNPIIRALYKVFYVGIGGSLIMVITTLVISIYTLDANTRVSCRRAQLAALTYLLVFTCLPLLHLVATSLLLKSKDQESFGEGSMTTKVIIVTCSSCLSILIAGFKGGASWSPPRPVSDPAWFDSKACFYIFNFASEILILGLLTFSRFDKRFYVPDGCSKPGDYTRLAKSGVVRVERDSDRLSAASYMHEKA